MKWGLWSVTAGNNSATPPDGWPEGQAPSTVNDCAREMMAQIATGLQDLQFVDLGLSPTQTGNTTFTVPGSHATLLHYGRRIKAFDGANTLYGTIISSTATTNTGVTLRMDSGVLDTSLSAFAVGFPGQLNTALPEGAKRTRNYIRNSQMDIWQRGGGAFSFSGVASGYTADGWLWGQTITAGAAVSVTRSEASQSASNVPTLAVSGVLMRNSLCISVNAVSTVINSGNVAYMTQRIEGYQYRQFAGKPMTVQFWTKSNLTGTYCLALNNGDSTWSCVNEFQISSANTWQQQAVVFPKTPQTGTWDYSTGVGLVVRVVLAAGSGEQGGAGNWTATSIYATSNQVNFFSSAGNEIRLTGFDLHEGTSFEPLEPINLAAETDECSRYLNVQPLGGVFLGFAVTTSQFFSNYIFSTKMRATPTLSLAGAVNGAGFFVTTAAGAGISASAVAFNTRSTAQGSILVNAVGTSLVLGQGGQFLPSATVPMIWKAEL